MVLVEGLFVSVHPPSAPRRPSKRRPAAFKDGSVWHPHPHPVDRSHIMADTPQRRGSTFFLPLSLEEAAVVVTLRMPRFFDRIRHTGPSNQTDYVQSRSVTGHGTRFGLA